MFIDINKIGRDGVGFDLDPELRGLEDATGEPIPVHRARLVGRVDREPEGVELRGSLDAAFSLACSRCLEPFETSIRAEFSFRVVERETEPGADDVEIGEDETRLLAADGGVVRLDELAREQIYLSLPLKPVCRDGCRGLCPRCGENRNLVECGCVNEEIDPRLAPLLELKRSRSRP